jgi:formylglycine-generating enzyme required for sulfatase activity
VPRTRISAVAFALVLSACSRTPAPAAAPTPAAALSACPPGKAAIPGGVFAKAGAAPATVQAFCLDVIEVTVADYAACVKRGGCTPAFATADHPGITDAQRAAAGKFCNEDKPDRQDHPVNCVDWSQAKAYCTSRGERLPTDLEWEWAARGEERATTYPWGDAALADQACWNGGNVVSGARRSTCRVASHPLGDNPQGIHDLSGNVWEWVEDGGETADLRVHRGGSWALQKPELLAADSRGQAESTVRQSSVGFRCAKSF